MEDAPQRVERVKQLINDVGWLGWAEVGLTVLTAIALIVVSRRVLEWVAGWVPSRARLYVLGTVPVLRLVVIVGAVLWIVPIVFDVTLANFVFIAGGVSVALGFAVKDLASAVLAGIVALVERPYRAGDWVRIDGDYGEVRNIGMRSLQIVTPDDDVVTIPHDRIYEQNVSTSNDGAHTLMCVANLYVASPHDAGALREALYEVARTSAWLHWDKPILVIVDQQPWGARYRIKAYPFDMRDQFLFITDLTVRGKRAIRALGLNEAEVPGLPPSPERD